MSLGLQVRTLFRVPIHLEKYIVRIPCTPGAGRTLGLERIKGNAVSTEVVF